MPAGESWKDSGFPGEMCDYVSGKIAGSSPGCDTWMDGDEDVTNWGKTAWKQYCNNKRCRETCRKSCKECTGQCKIKVCQQHNFLLL